MAEETIRCPRCESELVISVGNQRHCNSCGLDHAFQIKPRPEVERHRWSGHFDAPFVGNNLIPPQDPKTFIQPKGKQ
jgi:hypothetical protein